MSQDIKSIDVHQLKQQMDSNPNLCLIDVREIDEWQAQRIPGAIHIPKDQITMEIAKHVQDKNQPIFLHCRSGGRSLFAAQRLKEMGYQDVYNVSGGILDWASFGYPTEN